MCKPSICLLSNGEELDLERQLRIRRNRVAGAALSVSEIGRNDQLSLASHLDALHAFIPALDHLSGTEFEGERPAAVETAVELLTVLQPAGVMNVNHVAGRGCFAGAFLDLD